MKLSILLFIFTAFSYHSASCASRHDSIINFFFKCMKDYTKLGKKTAFPHFEGVLREQDRHNCRASIFSACLFRSNCMI